MRILFLSPGVPLLRRRGFQVRAFHQIRQLAARHRITLLSFGPTDPTTRECCDRVVEVPLGIPGMLAGLSRAPFSGRPLQASLHETPRMRRALDQELARGDYDVVHVQLARLAGLLEGRATPPRVIDLVDALSLNMERRSLRDHGPMAVAARIEVPRLQRFERTICASWDHATVVSPIDRREIGDYPNLSVNGSGVDFAEFPFHENGDRSPNGVVFIGNLGYFPNVDAICWYAREVFPLVRRELPDATLDVIGASPARAVTALASADSGITVHGPVESVAPYLARCAVAVAPMRAGSGQLFKVLEAMACGAPLVATPTAISGVDAKPERHVLVGDTAKTLAAQTVRLLRNPRLARTLARDARKLVEERHSWATSVGEMEAVYESVTASRVRVPLGGAAAR